MEQPIPAYLLALAAGQVEYRDVGERCAVYAVPELIDAAAYEFGEMEQLLLAAEELYGTYAWDRYDLLILPAAFPFGGMENPTADVCHAYHHRGRPLSGRPRGPRIGAQLERQPRHQRHMG